MKKSKFVHEKVGLRSRHTSMIFRLTEQLKLAKPQSADWLAGGGEMGERIRSADWAKTPSVQLFPDPRASHDAQGRIIGD